MKTREIKIANNEKRQTRILNAIKDSFEMKDLLNVVVAAVVVVVVVVVTLLLLHLIDNYLFDNSNYLNDFLNLTLLTRSFINDVTLSVV